MPLLPVIKLIPIGALVVSLKIFIKTFARGSPDMASVTVPVRMPVDTGSSSSLHPWITNMMIKITNVSLITLPMCLICFIVLINLLNTLNNKCQKAFIIAF